MERYEANVPSVTRQLRYEPSGNRTIDVGLFVNGIPVATAELKNPLTGQNVEHAIAQYRRRRDPRNRTLRRVRVVHFAVGPNSVVITDRLILDRHLQDTLSGGGGRESNPPGVV